MKKKRSAYTRAVQRVTLRHQRLIDKYPRTMGYGTAAANIGVGHHMIKTALKTPAPMPLRVAVGAAGVGASALGGAVGYATATRKRRRARALAARRSEGLVDVNGLLEDAYDLMEKLSMSTTAQLGKRIAKSQAKRHWTWSPARRMKRKRSPVYKSVMTNVSKSRAYRVFKKQHGMTDAQMRAVLSDGVRRVMP